MKTAGALVLLLRVWRRGGLVGHLEVDVREGPGTMDGVGQV